ncbi:MAG: hypothetical protein ACKO96_07970, partial [Flammeovirgaceae bacterium]
MGQDAASKRHHCRNTNVGCNALRTKEPMTEQELTDSDRKRIKDDISLTFILTTLLILAITLLFGILIGVVSLIAGRPTEGFGTRALIGIGTFSLPLLWVSWENILKFIDLKRARKILITTADYKIESKKEGAILVT